MNPGCGKTERGAAAVARMESGGQAESPTGVPEAALLEGLTAGAQFAFSTQPGPRGLFLQCYVTLVNVVKQVAKSAIYKILRFCFSDIILNPVHFLVPPSETSTWTNSKFSPGSSKQMVRVTHSLHVG